MKESDNGGGPLISVIIPVYNAEKFLGTCLKSVVGAMAGLEGGSSNGRAGGNSAGVATPVQGLKTGTPWEIVLVDNDSTDGSIGVEQRWQKRYPLAVRVIECQRHGAAAARNDGVKAANGKYLWFVDADDMVVPGAARRLIEAAEKAQADVVMMGAERVFSAGSGGGASDGVGGSGDDRGGFGGDAGGSRDGADDFRGERREPLMLIAANDPDYRGKLVRCGAGPWQFLLRRTWWQEHDLAFCEGIIHEDMELMPALALYADRYASVPEVLYLYQQNAGSVLHKQEWDEHYLDIFAALTGAHERFVAAGAAEKYHDELEWFFVWNLLIDSARDFGRFREGREGFARARKMLKTYYPRWRRNRLLKNANWKTKVRVRLNYWGLAKGQSSIFTNGSPHA